MNQFETLVPAAQPPAAVTWTLSEIRNDGHSPRVVTLSDMPVTVGRAPNSMLCIPSSSVSKRHAEIRMAAEGPVVHDLGSTNGTHVNGERIECVQLKAGDVLQFANSVFRIGAQQPEDHSATREEGAQPWAQALIQFDSLMNSTGLLPHFQAVVDIATGATTGYEMLARSSLSGLEHPGLMFSTAAQLDQEVALSEMLRMAGVESACTMATPGEIFLNTHPKEIGHPQFLKSLDAIRAAAPKLPVVIELHEGAITSAAEMREIRNHLQSLNMGLAYDDFGAGQARLDELADVPPDYLKFDIKLIRNIDDTSSPKHSLVASLVEMVLQLGVAPLAEGVETAAEASACIDLGFRFAQGYFYARPTPLSLLV